MGRITPKKTEAGKAIYKAMVDKDINLIQLSILATAVAKDKGYVDVGTSKSNISRAMYSLNPNKHLMECISEVLDIL